MADLERGDPRRPELVGGPFGELDEVGLERALDRGGARVQRLERAVDALADAGRAGDLERPGPLGELSVEDQPGESGEVVAVEMAERDEPDRRGSISARFSATSVVAPQSSSSGSAPPARCRQA